MAIKNLIELRSCNKDITVSFKDKSYQFNINHFIYLKDIEKYFKNITDDLLNILSYTYVHKDFEINYNELLNFRLAYEFDNINESIEDYHIVIKCKSVTPAINVHF